MARAEPKSSWAPSEGAFRRFLAWLDGGVDSGGERYVEMRRRLELYFERRDCHHAEELADETLNRVTRRLDEEGTIQTDSPAHYCYIVARMVLFESIRRARAIVYVSADDSGALHRARVGHDADVDADDLLGCLDECLRTLAAPDRELILDYYRGEQRAKIEQRRHLAARLGLTMNALTIRACRLREKLETCVKARLQSKRSLLAGSVSSRMRDAQQTGNR